MSDSSFSKLQDSIKTIALKAIETNKPSGIFYGTVVSTTPLKISVEQKMLLEAGFLVLSTLVQDFTIDMTVDHTTGNTDGGSSETAFASHHHAYEGTKSFRIRLGLQPGEKVILLRVQGGQQFIVLDRVR